MRDAVYNVSMALERQLIAQNELVSCANDNVGRTGLQKPDMTCISKARDCSNSFAAYQQANEQYVLREDSHVSVCLV